MDAAEFAKVGAELVDLGGQLNTLKAKRAAIDTEIAELELRVRPLITRHAQMIAEIVGSPVPAPTSAPSLAQQTFPNEKPSEASAEAKRRIIQYLRNSEPGTSALDIASALRIDAELVRRIMHEMYTTQQRE